MVKRIAIILLTLLTLSIAAVPLTACADGIDDISRDFEVILDESGADVDMESAAHLEIGDIVGSVSESLSDRLAAPVKMLGILLTVTIMTAFVKNTGDELSGGANSDIFSIVCVLASVTAVMPRLFEVYERTFRIIVSTGGFISVFVPAFAGLTAAMGGLSSAGAYNLLILGASEIVIRLCNNCFMPIVSAVSALSAAGAVFSDNSLEKFTAMVKKVLVWTMTAAVTLFTGFVSMKCTLAGKADGVASKTVKFAISGFIPIAGGAVSDAYSTVRSSFDVIRCTAGTAGTIAIVLIMLPPVLEIAVYRAVMWVGTAVGELFSAEPVTKLLGALDCGLAIAQSVLICYSLMFVVCTGILMNCAYT